MDKLKRFIDIFVPTETCNLRCSYCYITQNRKFNGKLFEFDHTIDDIKKSFSQERLGGVCLINFCAGGETLLTPIVIDIIKALLECGHYLMIVTNGTLAQRFEEMSKFPEQLRKRLFIKFSFHYLELKRTNQLNTFIDNVKLIKRNEFCYAGNWSFCVDLKTGDITKCFGDKVIGNIYEYDKEIKYECVGCNCKYPYCYAGHAFLALGVIPEVSIGTFDELRDRPIAGWLSEEMKNIMSQKLENNNEKYGSLKKYLINQKIKNEKNKNLKNYNYNLIKKLKNDRTQFVDIIESRQELTNIFKNIPSKYQWIYNYNKDRENKMLNDKLKIVSLNEKNEKSQGKEICFIGILTNDNWYYANELVECNWIERNNCLVWRDYDLDEEISNEISVSVPKSKKITLVFEKNKWRGKCKIITDNKNIEVDCYSDENDELLFINVK